MSDNLPSVVNTAHLPPSVEPRILIPRPQTGGVWTTLRLQNEDDKIRAANMATGKCISVEELAGKECLVQDLLLKGIQITAPDTGEITDATLTLLIPPTGTPVQCVSSGVIGSLETVAVLIGAPPWKPPLRVQVEQFRTRGKMLAYRLNILGRASE